MRRNAFTAALLALTAAAAAERVEAQPRPSQHGSVSQMVNETLITLEYDRPIARGRALFGELIEYDVIWTPGANRATWIEFSTDVQVEGRPVEAGRYGVWTVPKRDEPWELVLVGEWDTHHGYFSFETEALRVEVPSEETEHMETLAFYFPVVGPYETILRFHWGTTAVPIRITVPE